MDILSHFIRWIGIFWDSWAFFINFMWSPWWILSNGVFLDFTPVTVGLASGIGFGAPILNSNAHVYTRNGIFAYTPQAPPGNWCLMKSKGRGLWSLETFFSRLTWYTISSSSLLLPPRRQQYVVFTQAFFFTFIPLQEHISMSKLEIHTTYVRETTPDSSFLWLWWESQLWGKGLHTSGLFI